MGLTDVARDPATFRRVMGQLATGVTLITAQAGTVQHGMTANAVISVSLEPMLVLISVRREARMVAVLREAGHFVINILARDQEPIARHFAGQPVLEPRPELPIEPWEGGLRLAGCLAAIACRVVDWLPGGDHWLVVGEVTALALGEPGAPLLYYGGQYRTLAPAAPAPAPAPDLLDSLGAALYYDEGTPDPVPWDE